MRERGQAKLRRTAAPSSSAFWNAAMGWSSSSESPPTLRWHRGGGIERGRFWVTKWGGVYFFSGDEEEGEEGTEPLFQTIGRGAARSGPKE